MFKKFLFFFFLLVVVKKQGRSCLETETDEERADPVFTAPFISNAKRLLHALPREIS